VSTAGKTASVLLLAAAVLASVACSSNGGSPVEQTPTSSAGPALSGDLTVFAAAHFTEVFQEMKASLEESNPDLTITFSFASSTQLRVQLEQGARADVYASGDEKEMDLARDAGLLGSEAAVFAHDRLVVILPRDNPADIETLQDLARPGVKLDLVNENAPAGAYAREFLQRASATSAFGTDFEQGALANVASEEENVKQVVAKVRLGETDAGICYASDVTPEAASDLLTIDIPGDLNPMAIHLIAVLKDAGNLTLARSFVDYVLSAEGQAILQAQGFLPAAP
jgi:molybdate transport system substrate-binding protein